MKALAAALCVASPALAEPFDAGDRVLAVGAGVLGGTAGGLALGFLAAEGSPDIGGVIVGLGVGFFFGSASAVYAYGQASGRDGSYLETLVGAGAGLAGTVGVLILLISTDDPDASDAYEVTFGLLGWSSLLLPPIGAMLGYDWSLEDGPPPSGALFDYHPVAGLRLSVPVVAVGAHDGFQLAVPMLGGRF